jgi:hypothetical protein
MKIHDLLNNSLISHHPIDLGRLEATERPNYAPLMPRAMPLETGGYPHHHAIVYFLYLD